MADAALLASNFVLGVLAFFSPCGLPMLPAYLAYYLTREGESRTTAIRGLAGGLLASLGAFAVLAVVGVLAMAIGAPFKERVIWLELVGGIVVLALGVLVLLGRGPSVRFALQPSTRRGAWGLVSFGALYAGVAASCVAPLFITMLVIAGEAGGADAALLVGAYAFGFASLLTGVTVLVATARHGAVAWLKKAIPRAERAGGIVLVAVGLYLIWYWARVAF